MSLRRYIDLVESAKRESVLTEVTLYSLTAPLDPDDGTVERRFGKPALPNPDDDAAMVRYYTGGACEKFALMLHRIFGYSIVSVSSKDPELMALSGDPMIAATHVFCVAGSTDSDAVAVDVAGKTTVRQMREKWDGRHLIPWTREMTKEMEAEELFRRTERRMLMQFIEANRARYAP